MLVSRFEIPLNQPIDLSCNILITRTSSIVFGAVFFWFDHESSTKFVRRGSRTVPLDPLLARWFSQPKPSMYRDIFRDIFHCYVWWHRRVQVPPKDIKRLVSCCFTHCFCSPNFCSLDLEAPPTNTTEYGHGLQLRIQQKKVIDLNTEPTSKSHSTS